MTGYDGPITVTIEDVLDYTPPTQPTIVGARRRNARGRYGCATSCGFSRWTEVEIVRAVDDFTPPEHLTYFYRVAATAEEIDSLYYEELLGAAWDDESTHFQIHDHLRGWIAIIGVDQAGNVGERSEPIRVR